MVLAHLGFEVPELVVAQGLLAQAEFGASEAAGRWGLLGPASARRSKELEGWQR